MSGGEDLYAGRVTIRQIRASSYPGFNMKRAWEGILGYGGPGTITDRNYLICTSQAFWVCLASWGTPSHIMEASLFNQSVAEYIRKYPLTMLIQD